MTARREVTDWSLTVVATLMLIEAIVFPALAEMRMVAHLIANACFIGFLALIAYLMFDRTSAGKWFVLFALGLVVLHIGAASGSTIPPTLELIFALGTYLSLFVLLMSYTLADGHFNLHRIAGAIGGMLIVGLAFAQVHRWIALEFDGAYLLLGQPASFDAIANKLNYFSFVTLSTLGYGDITPAHPFARSAAVFEGLVGVLYPTALLGWVVSLAKKPTVAHD
jgi:Ion channel